MEQIRANGLNRFQVVQVLGGKEYVDRVRLAFGECGGRIEAPLSALQIGQQLHAVQDAIDRGSPLPWQDNVARRGAGQDHWKPPMPAAIRRIADSEDRQLAWQFFVFFSRMEYALKRSGFLKLGDRESGDRRAEPDWNAFGCKYDSDFKYNSSAELQQAVDYFLAHPPREQVVQNGGLAWADPDMYRGDKPPLKWLLVMVRRVRNNLFHGGKFPLISIEEPSRNGGLLANAIIILAATLQLDAEVRRWFFAFDE